MFSFLGSGAKLAAATMALATLMPMSNGARGHEPDAVEIALGSLIDAELAFAKLSSEQGIRPAFLANFASDGVVFEPAPVRLHDAWAKRAPPADPAALRLEWQPAQAGVALSGDMGYTTGPSKLTDARRPGFVRHGIFFSVWQRDARHAWKVGIDIGTTTPTTPDFVPLGTAPRPTYTGRANVAAQRTALLAIERRRGDAARAYANLLADDARLYRDGMPPLAGRAAVADYVASHASQIEWRPFDVRIAKSGDLAATYGKFQTRGGADGDKEGYYVHVWVRDVAGRWRLAYDIANP